MINLISVALLCEKRIYWQSDDFILYKIKDQSKVIIRELIGSLFILSIINIPDFIFLSQNLYINKLNIKIIHCHPDYLHINNIIKLIFISIGLEIFNNITHFSLFCKIRILAKHVKYIPQGPVTRANIPEKIIYTDRVRSVTSIKYNRS